MKDTKYKILAYFDNQSYRKLFNEVNSDYAENLQILLHNLSLFSYDVLIIGVILYKENISNIISAIKKNNADTNYYFGGCFFFIVYVMEKRINIRWCRLCNGYK